MEPIKIRWETGHMEIYPDFFFPTSTARIRKLIQVVALDFPHQDDLRMQMARYCEDRAEEILSDRKRLANEAVNYHQKVADLQPPIDTAKRRITALRACIQEQPKKARALGYDIVMHVHDEMIVDVPIEDTDALERINACMGEPIPWAPGLPLRGDGYETPFYMKD